MFYHLTIGLAIGLYCIKEKDLGILGILSITFRDMGTQCFLNFGDICHISFKDMGYFLKIIKGILDTGAPSRISMMELSWN